MHILGLLGMPRRVYTYQPELPWAGLNMFISLSSLILAAGFLLFLVDAVRSYLHGERATGNPWGAKTLEWATTSPPPSYNFRRLPVIQSDDGTVDRAEFGVVSGMRVDRRELLITSVVDALPEARESSPGPSIWPLLSAIATSAVLIWSIFSPWAVVWGSIPVAIGLTAWFWPKGAKEEEA
jgi:cytochrome c oxidase subunit 1